MGKRVREKENGIPAFAGMTVVFVEKLFLPTAVAPAKAGVPICFLSLKHAGFQQSVRRFFWPAT
jgi:hypothetical protein